ncbi:hypothetical protein [Streptomyces sp. NPDC060205]|uniref:hypothetical protein n=1 Tax=Streptomyces sp. NPDC060205 TaxID=3347072 RepID=UPI003664A434
MTEQEVPQMLPEVQKYFQSIETATKARDAAEGSAAKAYPERTSYGETGRRQRAAYSEERDKAYDAFTDARTAAWDALRSSGDPLVKWIAENCVEYPEQAQRILAALPATIDEIDDLADTNDWCSVWDDFRRRATDAGVVPPANPPSPARKALFERIDEEGCCRMGWRAKRRIGIALDALIQESLTAAASSTEANAGEVPA